MARFFFSTPRCFLLIPGARRISLWGSQGSWLLGDEILVGTAWLESTQGFSLLSVAPDEETWCQKNSSFSRRVAADKKQELLNWTAGRNVLHRMRYTDLMNPGLLYVGHFNMLSDEGRARSWCISTIWPEVYDLRQWHLYTTMSCLSFSCYNMKKPSPPDLTLTYHLIWVLDLPDARCVCKSLQPGFENVLEILRAEERRLLYQHRIGFRSMPSTVRCVIISCPHT